MGKYKLTDSVDLLSGVGETRKKQLAKLGINNLYDLVYYFPRAYEKRGDVRLLSEVDFNLPVATVLTVGTEVRNAKIRQGLTVSKFRAFDESGTCEVVFFNSPYVKDVFFVGCEFRFYGKMTLSKKTLQLVNPKFEPINPVVPLPSLVPIYPLTQGISSNFIDKITKNAIDDILPSITDPLPDDIRIGNSLPVLSYALKNAHFPESEEALKKALRRLAFDEMLLFGLGIAQNSGKKRSDCGIPISPCNLKPLTELLPYELTNSQKNAINDIYRDMVIKDNNGRIAPMARILVGDVGSGKTVCAVAAIYTVTQSGFQAAMMAPTEILARQHYNDISNLLATLGIKTELLLGSTTQKEKKRIYESVKSGETQIVIGTHALISEKLEFNNLALVITDEQHRFGVAQRASLRDKSKKAHMLVMSATPIPRTLALTMYGDLDVSRITEMPKGRMKVDTYVVDESYRERLNTFISRQVENGGQCYIVCPAIENESLETENEFVVESLSLGCAESSVANLKNIKNYAEILKQNLPSLKIASLHGKMSAKEKNEIMSSFSKGETDVLVSTTVIEVGVNVPNASLMIIENAERFGLAQLHQLRGRVGRGTRKSYCILVSDSDSDTAKSRLEIMKNTYDGYEIAEKDLLLRGPGDFFGRTSEELRQSGGFEFKMAKLCDDTELFNAAFASAKQIISSDPELLKLENYGLRELLHNKFEHNSSNIS